MGGAQDSGRWCATHAAWGDHHTDRCPSTYGVKSPQEHEWDMVQAQVARMTGTDPKPYPGDAATSTVKASGAVSAKYANTCPTCHAGPQEPCRSKITRRVTDTHRARIDTQFQKDQP